MTQWSIHTEYAVYEVQYHLFFPVLYCCSYSNTATAAVCIMQARPRPQIDAADSGKHVLVHMNIAFRQKKSACQQQRGLLLRYCCCSHQNYSPRSSASHPKKIFTRGTKSNDVAQAWQRREHGARSLPVLSQINGLQQRDIRKFFNSTTHGGWGGFIHWSYVCTLQMRRRAIRLHSSIIHYHRRTGGSTRITTCSYILKKLHTAAVR